MSGSGSSGSIISIVGDLMGADAARDQGRMAQQEAYYEAEQARVNANTALSISQIAAQEERRQGELVQSRAIALMAASGGGVTDPGNVTLLARNAGETAYRSAVALYKGEDEARTLRAQADAAVYSGQSAKASANARARAYNVKAFGDLVGAASGSGGGSSLFDRFSSQAPAPVVNRDIR